MILGPSNELLIADSALNGKGAVWIAQGKEKRKLIEGLDRPFGMAFWKDYLYVGEPTSIKRYKARLHGFLELKATERGLVVDRARHRRVLELCAVGARAAQHRAFEIGVGEIGLEEIGIFENSAGELGAAYVHARQIGAAHNGVREIRHRDDRFSELGVGQIHALGRDAAEIGPATADSPDTRGVLGRGAKDRLRHIRVAETGVVHLRAAKHRTAQIADRKIDMIEIGVRQIGGEEHRVLKACALEMSPPAASRR